jgi:hypothetical protein
MVREGGDNERVVVHEGDNRVIVHEGKGGEGGGGEGDSEKLKNEFLIFRKNGNINLGNSNINLGYSNDSSLDNSNSNNKYIELDASEDLMLNISDINNSNLEVIKNKKGGNKKKVAVIKGSRKISIEPSYNKDSILNNSKIYKLTKL